MEYVKLFFILFLFFAILYGGYYFSVKVKTSGIKNFKSNGLKVIQGLYIGPNQSLQLVKIYDRYVILGVTKERIELLMELSEDEISDEEMETGFSKTLDRFKKAAKTSKEVEEGNEK